MKKQRKVVITTTYNELGIIIDTKVEEAHSQTCNQLGTDAISRQAAIDALHMDTSIIPFEKAREYADATISEIRNRLEKLPSTQPDIIRCKDCKHWIPYDWMFSDVWRSKNMADYPEDEIGCNCSDMAMKANDFCSRAERREVTE